MNNICSISIRKMCFLISIISFLTLDLEADTTTVYGTIPSYANRVLSIKYVYDPVCELSEELGSAKADSSGFFKIKFSSDKVYYGTIEIGKLKAYIFLEPGGKYEITLPQYAPKAPEDLINPYFEYYEFYVKILNAETNELNNAVHLFDFEFSDFLDAKFPLINMQGPKARLDTVEIYYQNKFILTKSFFFRQYIHYNIAGIQSAAYSKTPETIFKILFQKNYDDFQNPAFYDFFQQNYKNFFEYFTEISGFSDAITNGNVQKVFEIIRSKGWIENEKMLQLGFLKGSYDAFYEKLYASDAIFLLLTNYINEQQDEGLRRIAENVLAKITKLRVGSPAPDFKLYGPDSLSYSLYDFRGYYVYLNFCTTSSFGCLQQYGLLQAVDENYLDSLKIITIAADEDFAKTYEHFVKNKYRWELLSFQRQPDVLEKYEIKAYPSYFLIDPDGNLMWAPAPSPNEGFASKYYDFIRDLKIKKQKEEGTYDPAFWK